MTEELQRTDDHQSAENKEEPSLAEALQKNFERMQEGEKESVSEAAPIEASSKEDTKPVDTSSQQKETETTTTIEASQPLEAPQHWSAKDREDFSQIPPEHREIVLRRHKEMEADYTRKTQDLAEERRTYSALQRVFEPFKNDLALSGLDELTLIKQYVEINQRLNKDPASTIKWLAEQRGVSLTSLTEEEDSYLDPKTAELEKQNRHLQHRLETIEGNINKSQVGSAQAAVDTFANERDTSGSLKHPYFQEARQHMSILMQGGVATDMEDAYQQAIRAKSTIYQKHQQTITQTDIAKKQEQDRARAEKAVNASFSVKSGGVEGKGGGQDPSKMELGSHLAANAKELGFSF